MDFELEKYGNNIIIRIPPFNTNIINTEIIINGSIKAYVFFSHVGFKNKIRNSKVHFYINPNEHTCIVNRYAGWDINEKIDELNKIFNRLSEIVKEEYNESEKKELNYFSNNHKSKRLFNIIMEKYKDSFKFYENCLYITIERTEKTNYLNDSEFYNYINDLLKDGLIEGKLKFIQNKYLP